MTELDILKACNLLLQSKYADQIPIYGRDVSDGFEMPSFFTEVVTNGYAYDSKNLAKFECAYKITYFQAEVDDIDQGTKVAEIRELFGKFINVGTRKVKVQDYETNYIGERNNILQMTINFNTIYTDTTVNADYETMDSIVLDQNLKQ